MKALVTGAAGFIGSHLVDRLLAEGWSVTGADDLSSGHMRWVNDDCDLYAEDFASDGVLSLVRSEAFDAVFHLAARPRVSYSVEHPLETNEANVTKTLALMDACRANVARFVLASSSSVYGGADVLPTHENCPTWPKSPYALQKLHGEQYLRLYRGLYGLDGVSLRFFNVFGPRQLGGSPYSTAVAAWLTAIKQGSPLRKDGTGDQTRDMCYVDNVVQALVLAADAAPTTLATFNVYNVGCNDPVSNNDVLHALTERYPGLTVVGAPLRPGDVMHTRADIGLAEAVLGYRPEVSFWDGFERTCEWYDREWENVKGMVGT